MPRYIEPSDHNINHGIEGVIAEKQQHQWLFHHRQCMAQYSQRRHGQHRNALEHNILQEGHKSACLLPMMTSLEKSPVQV